MASDASALSSPFASTESPPFVFSLTSAASITSCNSTRATSPSPSKSPLHQLATEFNLPLQQTRLCRLGPIHLSPRSDWASRRQPAIERDLVGAVIEREQLTVQALAYGTTNFHTHIATTNTQTQSPERGHNKQGRHDLRQLGLALLLAYEVTTGPAGGSCLRVGCEMGE